MYSINNKKKTSILTPAFSQSRKSKPLRAFWAVAAVLAVCVFQNQDIALMSRVGAILIIVSALLPSYLWCIGYVKGLPIFPFLSMSYIFSHALSLVTEDQKVQAYSELDHFNMGLVVSLFLLIATIFWCILSRKSRKPQVVSVQSFADHQVYPFLASLIVLCIIYHICSSAGYLWLFLPNSAVSLLRAILPALTSFGLIVLGYKLGEQKLTRRQKNIFIGLLSLLILVSGASIYLNIPGVYLLLACMGYMFSSRKLPWKTLLIAFFIVAFLYIGKGETRNVYWAKGSIQPSQYVSLYTDWVKNSISIAANPLDTSASKAEDLGSRTSVSEMLLKVMKESGTERPYLNGKTYEVIPQLLVPRFLNPNKIRGAEANHMLSVYYGLKTYKETFTTAIGWGLLQEAYANFSWLGAVALGIFIGTLYGYVTYWSADYPPTSFRFLVATIFLVLAIRTEITLGTFIAVLAQSLFLLYIVRAVFMKSNLMIHASCK